MSPRNLHNTYSISHRTESLLFSWLHPDCSQPARGSAQCHSGASHDPAHSNAWSAMSCRRLCCTRSAAEARLKSSGCQGQYSSSANPFPHHLFILRLTPFVPKFSNLPSLYVIQPTQTFSPKPYGPWSLCRSPETA